MRAVLARNATTSRIFAVDRRSARPGSMLVLSADDLGSRSRPPRFAFCSSRKPMRPVAMRPGSTMLAGDAVPADLPCQGLGPAHEPDERRVLDSAEIGNRRNLRRTRSR